MSGRPKDQRPKGLTGQASDVFAFRLSSADRVKLFRLAHERSLTTGRHVAMSDVLRDALEEYFRAHA